MSPIKPRSHHAEKRYPDWLTSTSQLLCRTDTKLMVCEADVVRHFAEMPNSFGQIQPNMLEGVRRIQTRCVWPVFSSTRGGRLHYHDTSSTSYKHIPCRYWTGYANSRR